MQKNNDTIANEANGEPLVKAQVTVQNYPSGTIATVYSTNALTSPITQPIKVAADGTFHFYAPDGHYQYLINPVGGVPYYVYDVLFEDVGAVPSVLSASSGSSLVGFIQSGIGAIARELQSKERESVSVFDFMSAAQIADVQAGTLLIDVSTGIQAAFNSGHVAIFFPDGYKYKCSSGLTVPNGVIPYSNGFLPSSPPSGTQLVFDLSVATCVTIGSASLDSGGIRGITVTRASGSIPSGSIGVLINTGYNIILEDILSDRHDIGYKWYANAPNGIAGMMTRCYTSGIQSDHIVVDGWPELRGSQCRFGANGSNNFACNSFIKLLNSAGGGAFPNSINFENTQFNQGSNPNAYWIDMEQMSATAFYFLFTDCHVENISIAYIKNTSSAYQIGRFSGKGCSFNTVVPFFALNPITQINQFELVGNFVSANTMDLSGTTAMNSLTLTGNTFVGTTATFNSTGSYNPNASLNSIGNIWGNSSAVTIEGDSWKSALIADTFSGSTLANNTTCKTVSIISPGGSSIGSWTPVLSFGGGITGITYSTQSGAYQIVGNIVFAQFRIILTNVGSSTGVAAISGLFQQNSGSFQTGAGGLSTTNSGMVGLTAAPIILNGEVGTTPGYINLFQQGATGVGQLTDSNFSNSSSISGYVTYLI